MMNGQSHLYTARQTRELDRLAIESGSVSGFGLMQRAGRRVFDRICQRWPEVRRLAVFCGAGNNAGDGYVVAHLASQVGLVVNIYTLVDPEVLTGEARQAWQACVHENDNMLIRPFVPGMHWDTDMVVDALLGTGLARDLTGDWLAAVDCINASPWPVVAVDIPSGIHADSGQVMGTAVRADLTVAFIGLNRGLFTGQAPEYTGEVVFDDLELDESCYQAVLPGASLIPDSVLCYMRPRPRTLHKGRCGHVLVIGGNYGMAGASILSAKAALRTGSGLVSVATRSEHVHAVVVSQPELMAHGIEDAGALMPLLAKASVIVIGPGLGQDDWAKSLLSKALQSCLPVVLDADALNLLAVSPLHYESWILTPHVGEAARLLDRRVDEINADRFAAVTQLQQQFSGVVILKGAGSLIADTGDHIKVCHHGNPGMATAGMGDVLSGVVAGLVAQGLSHGHAAELGVWLHARAGDMEAEQRGEGGLLATDLLPHIRQILNG